MYALLRYGAAGFSGAMQGTREQTACGGVAAVRAVRRSRARPAPPGCCQHGARSRQQRSQPTLLCEDCHLLTVLAPPVELKVCRLLFLRHAGPPEGAAAGAERAREGPRARSRAGRRQGPPAAGGGAARQGRIDGGGRGRGGGGRVGRRARAALDGGDGDACGVSGEDQHGAWREQWPDPLSWTVSARLARSTSTAVALISAQTCCC